MRHKASNAPLVVDVCQSEVRRVGPREDERAQVGDPVVVQMRWFADAPVKPGGLEITGSDAGTRSGGDGIRLITADPVPPRMDISGGEPWKSSVRVKTPSQRRARATGPRLVPMEATQIGGRGR